MAWSREDYQDFRKAEPSLREQWLRVKFPAGVPAHWWFFVIESAEADLGRFQHVDPLGRRASLNYVLEMIDLALSMGGIKHYLAISIKARLVRRALQTISLEDMPVDAQPVRVIDEAMSSMPLSIGDALNAAERRRSEAAGDSGAFYASIRQAAQQSLPADEDIIKLGEIEYMLAELEPLVVFAPGEGAPALLSQWLSMKAQFEVGSADR